MPGPATYTPDHRPARAVYDRSTRVSTSVRGPDELTAVDARELIEANREADS